MMANHEFQNVKKIMVESIDIFGLRIIGNVSADTFSTVLVIPYPILKGYHLYQ